MRNNACFIFINLWVEKRRVLITFSSKTNEIINAINRLNHTSVSHYNKKNYHFQNGENPMFLFYFVIQLHCITYTNTKIRKYNPKVTPYTIYLQTLNSCNSSTFT